LKLNRIKETCLYVEDLEKTRSFYEDLLGLELISLVKGRHAFFRVGSEVLLCFLPSATMTEIKLPPHYALGKQHIAFEADFTSYKEFKAHLRRSKIKITHTQKWGEKGESFYFEDPSGHVLEIVQPGIWD
jgi:catechol 2,3-dioxygenase-like lactoylglutathione lyase family enzyme